MRSQLRAVGRTARTEERDEVKAVDGQLGKYRKPRDALKRQQQEINELERLKSFYQDQN